MASKATLLLIEPQTDQSQSLTALLDEAYQVISAVDEQQAISLLKANADTVSVILMADLSCERSKRLFNYLKVKEADQRLPILVIGSQLEDEVCALRQGAWDFIAKPYQNQVLLLRIKNAVERSQLTAFRQLRYLAEYDSLTGIYNKIKFFEVTKQMIEADSEQLYAFVRFDIDRFQLINSFFGTDEGDRLLCYIANRIQEFASQLAACSYGRMESDIFCICLPYADLNKTNLVELIRNYLYEYNTDYDIVPSMGIYLIQDRSLSVESMYNRAALAAKQCKGSYVKCFAYYNESLSVSLAREQEIINEMNTALENHQFIIYLQPKIDIQNGKPCGAEALTRWNHPKRGIMSPNDFIGIFEQNGFITKLDFYIWEQVCILLRKWLDNGYQPYPISVNISRVDLYNPKLVDMILELIRKYQIVPELLNLELTESAYTDNPIMLSETIERLQKHGFTIMMDDFGSGYSSLNILKDMDVDILKIDMRFLSKTKIAGRGENIIASVIRMSKWLNIPVIAEGVETMEQVAFLRSVGCDYVQGYYYEKPIPVEYYETKYLPQGHYQIHSFDSYRESKHIYDELFLNDPQIKKLFNSSNEAAVIYEFAEDKVELIRVNASYYNLLGYEDQALKAPDMLQLVAASDQEAMIELFRNAIHDKTSKAIDYTYLPAEGKRICLHLVLRYVTEISGKYILMGRLSMAQQQA
ncbi:EAL domain-containing protein [Dielma fastidiosa]|uniref:EAL domain-containing protein n=1 Tax=Dielma fastidiosa TaxID=1034346 RepID=A0AB35UPP1_9FIRM|nr:EAL domain-containing protein [Dielma fastidiosa]MDY5168722.1 EAL domain-containing protein [Dielma fastidiosa]